MPRALSKGRCAGWVVKRHFRELEAWTQLNNDNKKKRELSDLLTMIMFRNNDKTDNNQNKWQWPEKRQWSKKMITNYKDSQQSEGQATLISAAHQILWPLLLLLPFLLYCPTYPTHPSCSFCFFCSSFPSNPFSKSSPFCPSCFSLPLGPPVPFTPPVPPPLFYLSLASIDILDCK